MITSEIARRRANLYADLRSGKRKQGFGKLRSGDCFCCLGIACEVFRLDDTLKGTAYQWEEGVHGGYFFMNETTALPIAVLTYYGFPTWNPHVEMRYIPIRNRKSAEAACPFRAVVGGPPVLGCIALNDTVQMTFSEIADALEAQYPATEGEHD